MGRVGIRTAALISALALVVGGCGLTGDDDSAAPETTAAESTTTTTEPVDGQMEMVEPEIESPIEPMGDPSGADDPVAATADAVMIAAAIDVQAFWTDEFPDVYGEPYVELEGGFWSYGPGTTRADLPPCGGVTSYQDVAQNAFYCSGVDLIAWDRDELIEPFIDEFGAFTGALVMAHEFGHAVQARSGDFTRLRSVIAELQADCFAGAWVGHVAAGDSDIFRADPDDLDVAVAGLLEIRDAPGSDPEDPSAHGSGFDRVSAFNEGLRQGAARCADYRTDEPVVTQQVFDAGDTSGGNLSSAELIDLIVPDLNAYYTALFADLGGTWAPVDGVELFDPASDVVECGGEELSEEEGEFAVFFCAPENKAVLDEAGLLPALEDIGDFALGAELARQWAFAAQVQADIDENTRETFLHADCLTGLYSGDLFFELRDDAELSLSPGDLDEALISFLRFGGSEESGTVFERSAAFKTGFLGSLEDCDAILS